MNRTSCLLPKKIKTLCEHGCIYREKAFRHLACRKVSRLECAAPCKAEVCDCNRPKNENIKDIKKNHKDEVQLV